MTVHVPGPTSVIVAPLVPPAVQTEGVEVVNVTARPEEAVAWTVTGDWTIVLFARPPNVIIWLSGATGVKEFDVADGPPEPCAFRAVTEQVYVLPFVKPPTTSGLPLPVAEPDVPPLPDVHAAV